MLPNIRKFDIFVGDFDDSKKESIAIAISNIFECEWIFGAKYIQAISFPTEVFDEKEFAKQICQAIWNANGKYCRVSVVTCESKLNPLAAE